MRETWRINQPLLDPGMIEKASTLTVMVLCSYPAEEMKVRRDLISAMRRLNETLADARPSGS